MTSPVRRLYAFTAAVLVFFVAWAVLAAHPWSTVKATQDPRLVALARREHRLRSEARLVQLIVQRRLADYHSRLAVYHRQLAAYRSSLARRQAQQLAATPAPAPASSVAPAVHVVTLPPLVVTRTS